MILRIFIAVFSSLVTLYLLRELYYSYRYYGKKVYIKQDKLYKYGAIRYGYIVNKRKHKYTLMVVDYGLTYELVFDKDELDFQGGIF